MIMIDFQLSEIDWNSRNGGTKGWRHLRLPMHFIHHRMSSHHYINHFDTGNIDALCTAVLGAHLCAGVNWCLPHLPLLNVYSVVSRCFPSTTSSTHALRSSSKRSCMMTPGTMRPHSTVEMSRLATLESITYSR